MSYEIRSKNDFTTGVSLTVEIPESELDRKALYTIQADKPEFILPFHFKYVDDRVEFIYQVGAYNKLQYLSGERLPKDYAELWTGVISPLVDCGDWFMKPYSFVLNAEYLFYNKNKKTVNYLYIPSTRGCSGYAALKEMAAEVTRLISVADTDLENKVLRAVMKDFSPTDFLQMLKPYISVTLPAVSSYPESAWARGASPRPDTNGTGNIHVPAPVSTERSADIRGADVRNSYPHTAYPNNSHPHKADTHTPGTCLDGRSIQDTTTGAPGDIVINVPANGVSARKTKENAKKRNADSGRKEKEAEKQTSRAGMFNRKTAGQQEPQQPAALAQPAAFAQPEHRPMPDIEPVSTPDEGLNDITESITTGEAGAVRLKLTGNALVPQIIAIRIAAGETFTIGRFDAAIGKQQSSFEFDRKTKAISRRHAVIERYDEGYSIIDLSSSAGTFLNGHKLPPNTPCELDNGCRVSFGNAGAEYVWEET